MTEDDGVMMWAYGLLTSDPTLASLVSSRVYDSLAPQDTIGDYIVMSEQSYDEEGVGIAGDLGFGHMILLVKAVTQSAGYASAGAINKRISSVLHKQTGTVGDVTIKSCLRTGGKVRYKEVRDGVRYNHVGCLFNIYVAQ